MQNSQNLAILLLLSAFSTSAFATTCRRDLIEQRSAKAAASVILEDSDRVGIGTVRDTSFKDTRKQIVDILISFKGKPGSIDITPYQIGLVSVQDDLVRKFSYSSKELHIFALVKDRTGDGFASLVCTMMSLNAKEPADLVPELVAQSTKRSR